MNIQPSSTSVDTNINASPHTSTHAEKPTPALAYAELHCISNFSFLRGASRPEELVDTAVKLGYSALAITDECSMAGVVRAYGRMKELASDAPVAPGKITDNVMTQSSFKLIIGRANSR